MQSSHLIKFPGDLILSIVARLPLHAALNFLSTCKQLAVYWNQDLIWRQFGAKNFNDCITRLHRLPKDLQKLIITQPMTFNLQLAEDIFSLQCLPLEKQKTAAIEKKYLTSQSTDAIQHNLEQWVVSEDKQSIVFNRYIITSYANLITPQEMTSKNWLCCVLCDDNYMAILKNEQMMRCLAVHLGKYLHAAFFYDLVRCNQKIMSMFAKGLTSPEQLADQKLARKIKLVTSDSSIKALQNQWITLDQLKEKDQGYLEFILTSDLGFFALEYKLIDLEIIPKELLYTLQWQEDLGTFKSQVSNKALLFKEITSQIADNMKLIEKEVCNFFLWKSDANIQLWTDEISVLMTAKGVMQGVASLQDLTDAQQFHPRWNETRKVRELIEQVQELKSCCSIKSEDIFGLK